MVILWRMRMWVWSPKRYGMSIYPIVDALLTISSHTVFPYLLLMHRLLMI
jgi:hypothetical protein